VDGASLAALESQSRYITRPALAMDALEKLEDGSLSLETPPDPRTGATRVVLDPLEWIHRISALMFCVWLCSEIEGAKIRLFPFTSLFFLPLLGSTCFT